MNNLEREILREIGTITRCINSISDIKYKNINLQKGQFIFLIRVCENPGINQRDLSKLLKVDKTTTAKAIQKLINVDYIERKEDPSDKRMWRLYPLPKALEAYDYITEEENRVNKDYYNNFDKEEKNSLHKLLKKLNKNIKADWNKTK